jgi:hypothetical protein
VALVSRTDEGSPQFDGSVEPRQKPLVVREKTVGVESLHAQGRRDGVDHPEAIRTGEFLIALVPREEMEVMGVKLVDVEIMSGSLSYRAERHFTLISDKPHDGRGLMQ